MKRQRLRNLIESKLSRYLESIAKAASRRRRTIVLAFLLTPAVIYITEYFMALALVVMTGIVSIGVKRLELSRLGMEIATFSTVVLASVSETHTGAIYGLIFIAAQLFTGKPPGIYLIWVMPSYALAGYLAASISGYEIALLGTATAIGLQSVFLLFTSLTSRDRLPGYLQYAFFNVSFNFIMFAALGPIVLQILTG